MNLHEVYKNSGLGKWFHGESATKEPGWDRYNSEGKRVGKCGDAEEGAAYSACLSKQKAKKLGKEGVGNFVKRKRKAQSKRGRGKKGSDSKGKKPIFVKTGAAKMNEEYELQLILEGKNKPNDPEKWSECKSAAKSKFDVYPSAYANAWASKCYKKKGGTWRSVNEETTLDHVKELTKFNVLNNFMENAIMESKTNKGNKNKGNKPKHAPRGADHQRPKHFGRRGKADTEETQERRRARQEAQQGMYEEANVNKPLPVNTTQQRITDSIKAKAVDNLTRQRNVMGAPNPLNTENTPQAGVLAPEARADILSGDPKRQMALLRGLMSIGGRAAQKYRQMNKNNLNEGRVGSDKEKMEDPSSVGPPIDQAIIDAASLGGSTPLRVTPNVERILRDEQAYRNKLDTHINNYADYVNDLTKNIRLRSTGGYSKLNMYPEEGTR